MENVDDFPDFISGIKNEPKYWNHIRPQRIYKSDGD
ncbi:hypothetical protein LSH36_323g00002 [Paralvinella palmiformis]|uniref:Uncharacterized protein n=1 Tax=Paralvinella palmiformis TaxID=53620 RepID=A0AAD9N227_9ANNE|nr:hypothetical protein LSH36_323g00002 [Paralvinella palmiformis]